jgi:replication factor C subunit 2/4
MNNLPFSEKYRPKKLEDLVLDDIIYTKINNIIKNKIIPNIIFTGKSGVGKTSTIHSIARLIYPKEYQQDCVIELNASDDRGIKSVNDNIVNFCKRKVDFKEGYAQHKLIILDEADNITPKAQRLINSIMEKYPTTRFAFTCNNSSAVIESIQSRCMIIRFTKLPVDKFINRIKFICNSESIKYNDDALNYLFDICQRDLRKTLNMLELVFRSEGEITKETIMRVSDIPSQEALENLLNNIINSNVVGIFKIIDDFQIQGYYSLDVLLHFVQFIKNYKNISEEKRIYLINILSNKAYIMSKSSSNFLQLTGAFLNCI